MSISAIIEPFRQLPGWMQGCWIAWVIAGVLLFVMSVNATAERAKPTGKILAPQPSERVARTIDVSGTVADLPPGYTVWLAIRVGTLWWPKEPRVVPSGTTWSATVSEGGNPPDGRFAILLLLANRGATEELQEWFKRSDYAGLQQGAIPGIAVLDQVAVQLR